VRERRISPDGAAVATTIVEAPSVKSGPGAFAKLEDDGLVSAIRDGHDEAFEVFYDRYHDGVLSFCRHMLGSREDAEDAVQQTFLATYKQAQGGSPPAHPRAWLYTVARNRCLTTLRDRRESVSSSSEPPEPSTEGLDKEVERRQELRELLGDLGRLPEDQRVALLLFELGALDQTEIAETIGCAPQKVKALVYQARTTLAHRAEARNASCSGIREQLATLRGGTLNNRAIKHHLEICEGCSEFRDEVRRQRARFGLILPVIPLAASHHGVLSALGLAGGASHAAGNGAAHAGAVQAGAVHAAAGGSRAARLGAYATRPRVTALGLLTAGATAAGVAIFAGGHGRHAVERVVPPARAATPTAAAVAAKTRAPTAHRAAASQHHPTRTTVAHRSKPSGMVQQPSEPNKVLAPTPQTPTGTSPAPKAPNRNAPTGSNPPTHTPQGSNPPASSHPTDPPTTSPPTSTGTPPPTTTPQSSCGPNGQGGGHAWGHCKGPDGLPPPAEEHSQGQGDPGGPKH
jgi:RNA polymerase sigma factor (sigma-70 family)